MTFGKAEAGKPVFCLVDPSLRDLVGHHYEYDRAVAEGAKAAGYDVITLSHKKVIPAIADRLPVRATFSYDIWAIPDGVTSDEREVIEAACNEQFYNDLKTSTEYLCLDQDAVVFGHMVTARQLNGWARFAAQHNIEGGPTVVLLLRYQPEHYMGRLAEQAFALLETCASNGRLRLSSDSSRLADQLQRLTTIPIETWPLPHTTELEFEPAAALSDRRLLRVVSLGNARDEKGIIELLNAVRIIEAAGQADRFEFVFQANDANSDIAPALDRFAVENHPNVTLLTEALSTDDYFDLLKSADIVALPYWREIYVARTSGVFLEAVAAGKPVLCTRDTWMSDQLAIAGAGVQIDNRNANDLAISLIEMAVEFEPLAVRAMETRGRWLEIHNPASFMRALLHGQTAPAAASNRPSVAVLYPWGDALQNAAGAALRLSLFVRFLSERSSRVRVLEDGDHGDVLRDGVSIEATPVTRIMNGHWSYRWVSRVARHIFRAKNGEEFYFGLMLLPRYIRTVDRRINEIVKNSDLIFLEYPFWAPLVERACRRHGKEFVLSNYDVISDQVRVSKPLRWLTARLEQRSMRRASARVAVTENDRARFQAWGLTSVISPNCVDADAAAHRLPAPSFGLMTAHCGLPPDIRHVFLFVGSKFRPNILAAANVHAIAQRFSFLYPELKAHFVVVGACMEPTREPGFSALGRVDDLALKLLYENCTAVTIPLTVGTGLSLKTVEALAAGQVIVGAEIAFRGIPKGDRAGWIVEDDFSKYPRILAELVKDTEARQNISRAAATHGRLLDFRTAFAPYLKLAPRLAEAAPIIVSSAEDYQTYVMGAARAALACDMRDLALTLVGALCETHPTCAEAYQLRANIYLSEGADTAELALADLDRALINRASAAEVLRGRAAALLALGRTEDADRALNAAIAIALNMIWIPETELLLRSQLWLALHAGDKRWVYALTTAAIAVKGNQLPHEYFYLQANAALDVGVELEQALLSAKAALARGYDPFWGLMLIGDISDALDRREAAIEAYREASVRAATPEQKTAAANSAAQALWALFAAGAHDEVLAQTADLIALWPDHAVANYLRAEALKILGRELLEACDCYLIALRSGFRPYLVLQNLALLKIALGEAEEGLARLVDAFADARTPTERASLRAHGLEAGVAAGAVLGGEAALALLARLPPEDFKALREALGQIQGSADPATGAVVENVGSTLVA